MSAYSKEAEKYDHLRDAMVNETNKNKLIPVDTSLYSKNLQEKEILKHIKSALKSNK